MKTVRTVIFWLHLGIGCVAGLIIFVMALTGALLAFERQINAWTDQPAVLLAQSDPASQATIDSILATLKSDGQRTPSELVLRNSAKAPVEARFGREHAVYLNPWTAEIIGQPSELTRSIFGTIEHIHRSLGIGMQSAIGRGITGAANLTFLFMLLSGVYLWLPKAFNLTSFKNRIWLRGKLQGRAREWNWHHVIGIWAAIPLFFIVVTGVIISYPWASNLLYTITGTQPPANGWRGEHNADRSNGSIATSRNGSTHAEFRSIEDLVKTAKQQVPAWKSITIEVPQGQEPMLNLAIDKSVGGQPEQVLQVIMNRQNGRVQSVKQFSDNNTGRKLRAWARFLHTGEEFGLPGQIIAALSCFGAILLVWTGFSMTIRRVFANRIRLKEETELLTRGAHSTTVS